MDSKERLDLISAMKRLVGQKLLQAMPDSEYRREMRRLLDRYALVASDGSFPGAGHGHAGNPSS